MINLEPVDILNARKKDLDPATYSYKLATGQFAANTVSFEKPTIDVAKMSVEIVFADGNRRDGVGDITEVGGIITERHQKNPIVLFDHAKVVNLPVGLAEDPETKAYTVVIDEQSRIAKGNVFFYQGKNLPIGAAKDHALFCEQLFDLIVNGIIRAGSFAYSIIQATKLYADYETGTPAGLHLLKTLLLEFGPTVLPASPDTVRKMKEYPLCCGKPLLPILVKSFEPFAVESTKTVTGYEKAMDTPAGAKLKGTENYRSGVAYERCPYVDSEMRLIWQESWKEAYKVDHGKPYPLQKSVESQKPQDINKNRDFLTSRHQYLTGGSLPSPSLPTANDWRSEGVKELRKKYRNVKSCRRRHKKAMPGSSFIYVDRDKVKSAETQAMQMGLKFQRMGPSKNLPNVEKIKLIGSDESIDQIARDYGKSIRRGFKSMTTKNSKQKSAPVKKAGKKSLQDEEAKKDMEKVDDGTDVEVGGDEPAATNDDVADEALDQENGEDETPEKYSAQVLRTMHKDCQILMQQYDQMRLPLEHEETDKLLERKLQDLEADLTEIESIFEKHHSDIPPLEGAGAKDMGESEVEEEDTGDAAESADSAEEELPDAYEAVEGMNKKQQKTLRTKYKKGMPTCEKCGKTGCKCAAKSISEQENPKDTFTNEDKVDPGDDGVTNADTDFQSHEKKSIGGAANYLGELSTTQDFSDEHRMKAYHWHKSLEPLHTQEHDGGNDPSAQEFQNQSGVSEKNLEGAPVAAPSNSEEGSLSMAQKRSHIGNASNFLRKLSIERAYGDQHREEAAYHAKTLNPMAVEIEEQGVQEGNAPGAMGEKDMDEMDEEGMKHLNNVFSKNKSNLNNLTKSLELLTARFAS